MSSLFEADGVNFRRCTEEFNALQDEIAGRGSSRQPRLGKTREDVENRRTGRGSHAAVSDALQYMIVNVPGYKAAYNATWDALTVGEADAARQIALLEVKLAEAEAALTDTLDRAAELPDGTKVFRSADGRVYDGTGKDITHLAEHIEWTGLEPSWEEFQRQQKTVDDLSGDLRAWRDYQVRTLGHARDRLTDTKNPPDLDELDDIQRRIEDNAPQQHVEKAPAMADETVAVDMSKVAIPTI